LAASIPLTPEQRKMRAKLAAYTRWASTGDPNAVLAANREKSPASLNYFINQVDPDGTLPEKERHRRAEAARSAYFTRLSFAASKARSRKQRQ
jgi:hypothetical protein